MDEVLPGLRDDPGLAATWGKYADRIDANVVFGTHVLAWSLRSPLLEDDTGLGEAGLLATLKYRWSLELASAVAEQVRAGWGDPAAVTLRALFETAITLRFLTADRARMAERGRALPCGKLPGEAHRAGVLCAACQNCEARDAC
jgi:hypothetical protein